MFETIKLHLRASALMRRGNRAYQHGEYSDAVRLYREYLELRTDAPIALFNLGLALYKSGERRPAREQWKRVLELAKDRNPYLYEQAEIMLRQFS